MYTFIWLPRPDKDAHAEVFMSLNDAWKHFSKLVSDDFPDQIVELSRSDPYSETKAKLLHWISFIGHARLECPAGAFPS